MSLASALSFAAAALSGALAVLVLARERRSFTHRAFAAGMVFLAVEQALAGIGARALLPADAVLWQRWRLTVSALLPVTWLLFGLSFARTNFKAFLVRWRWLIGAALVLPLVAVGPLGPLLLRADARETMAGWLVPLGPSGYGLQLLLLLAAVLVIMNLEWTLLASTGSMRWSIKFMTLGVGVIFAARIYTSSQTLLFRSLDTTLLAVNAAALLVGSALILVSLARARLLDVDVYVSQSLLFNSLTVLFVGIYLLAVGVMAQAVRQFGGVQALPIAAFLVLLALVGLAVVLLSDQLRQSSKRFLSRNLRRPRYDYRKEWMAFSRRTASLLDIKPLCAAVTRMVSETLAAPSVTIWMLDERQDAIALGGSTVFSEAQALEMLAAEPARPGLRRLLGELPASVDLRRPDAEWARELEGGGAACLRQARWVVPLSAGRERVGFMTVSERPSSEEFSVEDLELLRTIADQAAASLLNLRLSETLRRAREAEAFQMLSAFFIHDLKNLASRLSLTMQNLPRHYDDPAFRSDMLATISRSVAKIDEMCGRLSPLSRKLELRRSAADLNELAEHTLAGLNGQLRASLVRDLRPVPPVVIDAEQIQKVLLNLVLNANDAVGEGGRIRVTTGERDGAAVLSVEDDGCGMSPEFMARSLFAPFQTTKRQGLGIGLFHSKTIVEAHRGRIEVESEVGRGSTFRVILPAGDA